MAFNLSPLLIKGGGFNSDDESDDDNKNYDDGNYDKQWWPSLKEEKKVTGFSLSALLKDGGINKGGSHRMSHLL